jgi:LAO/AO transport system kinase
VSNGQAAPRAAPGASGASSAHGDQLGHRTGPSGASSAHEDRPGRQPGPSPASPAHPAHPARPGRDVGSLVERLRAGDRRAVARLISLVEDGDVGADQLREVAEALNPVTGRATVLGLTGSPGVGKSTLANALVTAYRSEGRTVGVLAVDPSSPFTGGALLGDRVRMQHHALDQGVYIRSMATRGQLGGLAWATPQAVRVLDAAGYEVILVETVGVGQAEVEVAGLADTTLVVLAPGFGDAVQVAKAGILEVADVFVVNKADKDGADTVARDLRQMLHLGEARDWQVPVVRTVAERRSGLDELVERIAAHRAHLEAGGGLAERRRHRAAREIEELALADLREELGGLGQGEALDKLAEQVAAGELGPYSAADRLLAQVRGSGRGAASPARA